ncbi:N-alpha-acetyltransferase 25, NatB auxiliary subunit [Strongyloides ratti]|uniref:N-terminal acetyltransferase B complex subunit MDM20 homolog n=1 Tax=Strongyloides ratti TaxID=34506 RepID=A0A090LF81_STRRB|nr:N-alpha-acetyltransferase 25, NatB auxiliary subunit [Strongyloides ratti]CEF66788.1 N-alpha-acetyltransferase 25, NatB auxiliary subunit [Strongyloides ratti]
MSSLMKSKIADEKKIRKLVDLLENNKPNLVLKEVSSFIKKQGSIPPQIEALQALAYIRLDRIDDAGVILRKIEATFDSLVLDKNLEDFLTICYKELKDEGSMIDHLNRLLKRDPQNEHASNTLFNMYFLTKKWNEARSVATKMKQLFGNSRYILYNIAVTALEAYTGDDDMKEKRFMLAERMLDKVIKDSSEVTREHVELFVQLLLLQGKISEAIDKMDAYNDVLVRAYGNPEIVASRKIDYCMSIKKFDRGIKYAQEAIVEGYTNFTYLQVYIKGYDETKNIEYLEDLREILNERLEENTRNKLLGTMMCECRIDAKDEKFYDSILRYIHAFGKHPNAFTDVFPHARQLPDDKLERLLLTLKKLYELNPSENISYRVLYNELRSSLKIEDESTAYEAIELFIANKDKGVIANKFCHIAVSELLKLYYKKHNFEYILDAIYILEISRDTSPRNVYTRLMLISFYTQMGLLNETMTLWKEIDIKNIQYITLGYILLTCFENFGRFDDGIKELSHMTGDIDTCINETTDSTSKAFQNNSIDKVFSFRKFYETQLENNIVVHGSGTQLALLSSLFPLTDEEVITNTLKGGFFDIDWSNVTDNRDLSTFRQILFINNFDLDTFVNISGNESKIFMKFKSYICGMAYNLRVENREMFENIYQKLKTLVDTIKAKFVYEPTDINGFPASTELGLHIHNPLFELFMEACGESLKIKPVIVFDKIEKFDLWNFRNQLMHLGITTYYCQLLSLLFGKTEMKQFLKDTFQTLIGRVNELRLVFSSTSDYNLVKKDSEELTTGQKKLCKIIRRDYSTTLEDLESVIFFKMNRL